MSQLQKVEFDGEDYYLAEDVDKKIDYLDREVERLEGELSDMEDDRDGAQFEVDRVYESMRDNDKLAALLRKAASVLGDFRKQQYEVNFNGKITDISGFISDIEWEIKE